MSGKGIPNNSKREAAKPLRDRRRCVHFHDGCNGNSCGYYFRTLGGLMVHVDADCVGPSQCGMYQERKANGGRK